MNTPTPKHCRRVDGLPGTPCKTCGRIVVRKGSGRGMYRLTHEAAPAPEIEIDHDLCDREEHLRRRETGEDCPLVLEGEAL